MTRGLSGRDYSRAAKGPPPPELPKGLPGDRRRPWLRGRFACWLLGHDIPFTFEIPYGSQYETDPKKPRAATATAYSHPCRSCGAREAGRVTWLEGNHYVDDQKLHMAAVDAVGRRVVLASVPAWIRWAMPRKWR